MENLSASLLLALRVLMALALYAFLGWCFYILWRDLHHQSKNLARQRTPPLRVTLQGNDGVNNEQLRFTVPEITVGRHPSCEWMLPNETVSSRHARMVYHHDQWWLEDLNSRNGTFLNGEALIAPAVLAEKDIVRLGEVSFSVDFEEIKTISTP